MKLALLLTGHFIRRQGDTDGHYFREYCYPALKHFLLDRYDVDVYISTWNTNYLHNGSVAAQPVDPSIVLDILNPVKYHVRDYQEFYKNKKIIEFVNGPVLVNYNNQQVTFPKCECNRRNRDCKIEGCEAIEVNADSWSLVKEGFKLITDPKQYDCILRTRLDLAFHNLELLPNIEEKTIIVPPWKKDSVWDDFAKGDGATAYGKPEAMELYCKFIDAYQDLCLRDMPSANIHYTLGYYLQHSCGITQYEDSNIRYQFLKD